MPLKRTSEFRRQDYTYVSPDGEKYEITIVETSDRKYVEIKKDEEEITWDVEMLLDIADEVRYASRKSPAQGQGQKHGLKKPKIIDHRDIGESPSEQIQASVDESMENIDVSSAPVESFSSRDVAADIVNRKTSKPVKNPEAIIKPSGVSPSDIV